LPICSFDLIADIAVGMDMQENSKEHNTEFGHLCSALNAASSTKGSPWKSKWPSILFSVRHIVTLLDPKRHAVSFNVACGRRIWKGKSATRFNTEVGCTMRHPN
jgi:hypothetical protein